MFRVNSVYVASVQACLGLIQRTSYRFKLVEDRFSVLLIDLMLCRRLSRKTEVLAVKSVLVHNEIV